MNMMTQVTRQDKENFGKQFLDRKNSFDDDKENIVFQEFLKNTNSGVSEYLLKELNLPKGIKFKYEFKPTGERDMMQLPLYYYRGATIDSKGEPNDKGIDACFKNQHDDIVCLIDFERLGAWGDDWPSNYMNISFLERKAKYCNHDVNFFIVYFNRDMTKLLIVNKKDIISSDMVNENIPKYNISDNKRKLPHDRGYIFGNNLTDRERNNFT